MLRLPPALYIWPSLSYLDWIVEMKRPVLVLAGGHTEPLVAPAADELFTHALVMVSFQTPRTGLRHPNSNHFGGRVLELCPWSSSR